MEFAGRKFAAQNAVAEDSCQLESGRWVDKALDALLPRLCLACGDSPAPGGLCPDCRLGLPRLGPQCPRCAMPDTSGHVCGACLSHPPPQSQCHALFRYAEPVAGLLQRLKFSGALGVADCLGEMVAECWLPPDVDYLVPAPLHLQRLRRRGYNQALELCRPLARRHRLEIRPELLWRVRETQEQSRLSAAARRRNVREAFACRVPLAGERILLFDDVMTTGATMQAMARSLLAAGAGEVSCIAVARAV